MKTSSSPSSAVHHNLQRLNAIRGIAIGVQFLLLYYFQAIENIGLPGTTLVIILLLYSAVLAISSWRSHWQQPITETEFFGHLLVDIAFFTALLYFSGGAGNPFVFYYLVPVSIAATTLRWSFTWSITLLSLAGYTWLMAFSYPIPALSPSGGHHESPDDINLHVIGMWANFLISAVLITWFVVKMAIELRQQEELIAQQRENQLRDDQVLAVATLAAGTAHQLGTPLNTMQILVDEMTSQQQPPDTQADLETLRNQVRECRSTLQQLVATAEFNCDKHTQAQDLRDYFDALFVNWQVVRPAVQANIHVDTNAPDVPVCFPPTVAQSLQNLLNNAADVSQKIDIKLTWNPLQVELTIRDYGPGIPDDLSDNLAQQSGKPVASTKPGGLGLGLFLTRTAFNRIGGTVSIVNAPEGGAITRATLPLNSVTEFGEKRS